MTDEICEACENPDERIVIAMYGISLWQHGLQRRFCSSCLHQELVARGLWTDNPHGKPILEGEDQ